MAVTWLWKAGESSSGTPEIGDQYIAMGQQVLCLRNPMIVDRAVMGRLYAATIAITTILCLWLYWAIWNDSQSLDWGLIIPILFPIIMCFFLAHNIHLIKYQTNFFFNRHTQKVYYRKGKLLQVGDWDKVTAGMNSNLQFTGRAFSTTYSLILHAFGTDPNSEQYRLISKCWAPAFSILIDSNHPSDPRSYYIAGVWEYIRHFMEKGPDGLSIPQEPHWWNIPQNSIYLTPAQALRRYVPWRTGEIGEHQGKPWFMFPFWLILFPYNMTLALSWYAACRLVNVRAGEPPLAVFEGETDSLEKFYK